MTGKNDQQIELDEDTKEILDFFYNTTSTTMILPDGTKDEVPVTGNIGLLATGYKGVLAWRKKREEVYGKRLYSPIIEAFKLMQEKQDKLNDTK